MVEDFINDVCELLDIEVPIISYDTSNFLTDTTMALCNPILNVIYIKKTDTPDPDYVFCIAHELRHLYQYQFDEQHYLSGYTPSNNCSSVEEYNLQIAEVDANAFASIVMQDFFSMKPQWSGLSDKVVDAINKRINFLLTTEFALET